MALPPEPDPHLTRQSLLLRLRPGDPDREVAWREFYDTYGAIIGGFARNLGASKSDIPEIVQDVLIGFFKVSPVFVYSREKGRFRGYLKTCTWRVLQRRLKGRLRVAGLPVEEIPDSAPSVDEVWNDAWEHEQLRRAMEEVRLQYSARPDMAHTFQAFELCAMLGQSAELVADKLRIKVESVHQAKTRISKAIKAAFDRLNDSSG